MRKATAILAVVLVACGFAVIGCNKGKDVTPPPEKKLPAAPNANAPGGA